MRTQWMVLAFYLVDALLMAAYAWYGKLPWAVPLSFGALGGLLTGLFATGIRRGLHRRIGGPRFTTLQLLATSSLMVSTAAVAPQIGMLLLLTLIVALATAALQLPLRHVLEVAAFIALCTLALMVVQGPRFGIPLDDTRLRLLSGLWFAVVLAKIAAINLIGTQMRDALSASNARLALALTQVRELSERDELTGLQNRRSVLAQLMEERSRFARGGSAFAVGIVDLDHFKRVNDHHGHGVGDEVLRVFARAALGTLRATDRIARYGGEEFLLLLTQTPDASVAATVADRLRNAVKALDWSTVVPDLQLTCSIGLTISRHGESLADVLQRADTALYHAKSEGRDTVRCG
jgi:diguanylate cyclase